jgi:protein phosphatase
MSEDQIQTRIIGLTDAGLRREHNEDHIGFNQELGIAVLADGLGGHQAGEIAAHMAVESVLENLQNLAARTADGETARPLSGDRILEFISNTISYSNSLIYQASEALDEHKGMGTTLVATIVKGTRLYVGHVGDSRLYLYRNQSLNRMTKDHSLVQDLVDRGYYTDEEARMASVGHIVTRALGTRAEVEVDTMQHELEHEDLVLLCSDGLSDMVADWMIGETLAGGGGDLEHTAVTLVEQANRNGGNDNVSVILMQVCDLPDGNQIAE